MSSINAVGAPSQAVTISRQERLTSATLNPPPESSPQNLAQQQQQDDNAAAEERAQQRLQVNESERVAEIRDQRGSELADALRRINTPTPQEREEQEYNSPDYGRFDFSSAPMPVSDAMQSMLDAREYRQEQVQADNDRYAAERLASPVYNDVNAMTAAQTYEDARNNSIDATAAQQYRDSQSSIANLFGEENLNPTLATSTASQQFRADMAEFRQPELEQLNYAINPPTANPASETPVESNFAANAESSSPLAEVNAPNLAPGVGGTSAMRTLASGVRVSTAPDPTATINEIRPIVANQASALIDTQNLQNDYNTFSSINNSISNIGAQSSAIFNASQDSIRTPVNALNNQRAVEDAVEQISVDTQSVVAQSERLRAVNAGELTMVNSALRDLGNTPDPNSQNQTVTLQDLRANGRAAQTNDPEMAARVSENASRGISAVRNTVDTLQGNLLSAASTTLDSAMRRTEQLASGVNGAFSAGGSAETITTAESADALVQNITADLNLAPRRTLAIGSANINQINAAALAAI